MNPKNSTMGEIDRGGVNKNPGLIHECFEYGIQAIVYTPVYFVGIALIAVPFTLVMLAAPQSDLAGYTLLAYISWAVLFGQLMALNNYEGEEDLTGIAEVFVVIATFLYYNVATLLTVFIAGGIGMAIGPEAAVAVALVLPAVDVQSSRLYQFGLPYLMLGGAHRLATWTETMYEHIPIRELLSEVSAILYSVGNAVPPVVYYLSLYEFTRRRPLQ